MRFDIITAFPNVFSYLQESIPKRAQEKGKAEINIVDLRKFGTGKWRKLDDRPFGGGAGMVLQVEPIYRALKSIGINRQISNNDVSKLEHLTDSKPQKLVTDNRTRIYLMSARGKTWHQNYVEQSIRDFDRIVLICGHYEGVDQRVVDFLIDEEVSIGNYILSGGELASMVIVDSITRLIEGVVGKTESVVRETQFREDYKELEYPHYTRPEVFTTDEGERWSVPDVLTSGNHAEIEKWRKNNTHRMSLV